MPNPICESLGIRYPILLGGMAGVGTAPLVAAVSEAGGLGILGAGPWRREQLVDQIHRVRKLTRRPFGVNIPVRAEHAGELVDTVIREKVPAVTTSAGDPRMYTGRLQEHGVFVMHVVPTVSYAMGAERTGVNAVIAEGAESGGMTSLEEISTLALVPQVADSVRCPVIAAGGIGDGRGLAAALALGASGVQMGTAFMAAAECEISAGYKAALTIARDTDTVLVRSERSARRILREEFLSRVQAELEQTDPRLGRLLMADQGGSVRGAGQVAGLVREVLPAGEIVRRMVRDAERIISSLSRDIPWRHG